jgi:hypothetical protein
MVVLHVVFPRRLCGDGRRHHGKGGKEIKKGNKSDRSRRLDIDRMARRFEETVYARWIDHGHLVTKTANTERCYRTVHPTWRERGIPRNFAEVRRFCKETLPASPASNAGTLTTAPHLGHLTALPAIPALVLRTLAHFGHASFRIRCGTVRLI